jgi:2'-5' RNA ligase
VPTIGVAIAVPEPHASDLSRHRASFGDPQADTVPTHVTLLPPTAVDDADLTDVGKHLDEVAASHSPFDLHLRGSATFRPVSPVVFVAVAAGISECELLAADVRSGPLHRELCFPFHPHVTVAHDVGDDEMDRAFEALRDYECRFRVDSFVLFGHESTRGWWPRDEFPLGDQPG